MAQNMHLGPRETRLLLDLSGRDVAAFTMSEAKEILQTGDSSARHVVSNLVRKGRLRRIERGRYLLVPERAGPGLGWAEHGWRVVPGLVDEYYVGFWSAIKFWDMTEQVPGTVFVATPQRRPALEFGGERYRFVTLSERKFFGFVEHRAGGGGAFNVSTMEKTIVDGLAHPEYCGGVPEVAKAMWEARDRLDWGGVLSAAERTGIRAVVKRLGYLLDVLEIQEGISERIAGRVKRYPYQYLDPTAGRKTVSYSKEYGIMANMRRRDLLEWMEAR